MQPPPGGPSPYAPQPGSYQQPYSPYAQHASATAMPPPQKSGTSKLPLLIGVGGVVVVGAVIAIVMVTRGGKGGAASRDDLVADAFAAMTAGDGDKLLKLSDTANLFDKVFECKDKDSDDDSDKKNKKKNDDDFDPRHPDKMLEQLKKSTARYAESMKGTQFEIVEIETDPMPPLEADKDDAKDSKDKDSKDDDDDKEAKDRRRRREREKGVRVTKKGEKIVDGCKSKKTFQSQTVSIRMKITEPDHDPDKRKVEVDVTEIDGRYYLTFTPFVDKLVGPTIKYAGFLRDDMCACTDADCAKKIEKESFRIEMLKDSRDKMTSDEKDKIKSIEKEYKSCRKKASGKGNDTAEAIAKMTELTDRECACTDKACGDRVMEDMTKWSMDMARKADKPADVPDPEDAKKMADVMTRYTDCMTKLTAIAPPPPPPPPPPQVDFQQAPPDMPQICLDMRAELVKIAACDKFPATAKDSLRQTWDALVSGWNTMAASGRKAMEDACKSSVDSIKQSAQVMCP